MEVAGVQEVSHPVVIAETRLQSNTHIERESKRVTLFAMQHVQEHVRAVGDMRVPVGDKGETKREMDGWRPKGYAGTVDHPRGCPGQNIVEIKNSGH